MESNNRLVVHVGLPKTGTTSLQEGVFIPLDRQEMINYLGKSSNNSVKLLDYRFIRKTLFYDNEDYQTIEKAKNNLINLISDEGITSPKDNLLKRKLFGRNAEEFAAHIHKLFRKDFDEIKIVITLRSQAKMIPSFYFNVHGNYSQFEETNSMSKFINYFLSQPDNFDVWMYDLLVDEYAKLFGKDNIKILLYEDLKYDKDFFASEISSFLNIDCGIVAKLLADSHFNKRNKSAEGVETRITRAPKVKKVVSSLRKSRIKDYLALKHPKLWGILRDEIAMKIYKNIVHKKTIVQHQTDSEEKLIFDYYRESNIRLAEKHKIDRGKLKKYGYI